MKENKLYYGDNLDILRRYIKDETVDLCYIDPPFNSKQEYNVIYKEGDGVDSSAQLQAFGDTWKWGKDVNKLYDELVNTTKDSRNGNADRIQADEAKRVSEAIQGFELLLGKSSMFAYLVMMAARIVEIHRVLKPTGSFYLHCDWHADAYLRVLCDKIFGHNNLVNEIVWHYGLGAAKRSVGFTSKHDNIYLYTKSNRYTFNVLRGEVTEAMDKKYCHTDDVGRYMMAGGKKYYLKGGKQMDDVWDISAIAATSGERLGYPTQKPEALLERIIKASSNEGDVVLDCFCGCGTTLAVAQKLKRKWIGIDVTFLALNVLKERLRGDGMDTKEISTIGEPTTESEAAKLAGENKYQFQWWALGLVGARPAEMKKGADRGIDGMIYGMNGGLPFKVIIQVKGGAHVGSHDIRDLRGTMLREKAAIGVYITLAPPTKAMMTEVLEAGYQVPDARYPNEKYPAIQVLTIKELMGGKQIDMPNEARRPVHKTSTVADTTGDF